MKKIILIFVIIFHSLLFISDCFSQWIVQNSGVSVNLYDVKFLNRYTGWAVGDGGIIVKTTNGGDNWINVPNPSITGGGILSSLFIVDSNILYVVGGHEIILKSTNSGNTWIEIRNGPYGISTGFRGVYFLNKDTGWFCGSMRVLRTTDGGTTFDSTGIFWGSLADVFFKDFMTGLICGDGVVFKSNDAGMNWYNTNVPTGGWAHQFRKISVINKQYVWIVGNGNIVYKSTNFADSWDSIAYLPAYPPSVMYCSYFSSINTGWAGGSYGYLYKTIDGGYSWTRQATGTDQRFWGSIWFYNDSIGWGVGGAGKIMHTTTGGQSLVIIENLNRQVVDDYKLYQNFPNPFNTMTNVKFQMSKSGVVEIKVFDLLGREVKTLINEYKQPGTYQVSFNAEGLTSGIYFYKMTMGDFSETKKLVFAK